MEAELDLEQMLKVEGDKCYKCYTWGAASDDKLPYLVLANKEEKSSSVAGSRKLPVSTPEGGESAWVLVSDPEPTPDQRSQGGSAKNLQSILKVPRIAAAYPHAPVTRRLTDALAVMPPPLPPQVVRVCGILGKGCPRGGAR